MMRRSAPSRYSWPAIAFHWLVALGVLAAFSMGLVMTELAMSPNKLRLYSWHKWLGVTLFGVMWLRLVWRCWRRPPPLPLGMPAWQYRASALTHGALYALLLVIPVSGWLYSSAAGVPTVLYGLWPLPDLLDRDLAVAGRLKLVHLTLNGTLATLVLLHVAAALHHHFVRRDGLLRRMWPWGGQSPSGEIR